MLSLVVTLIVIGILLGLLNYFAADMKLDGKILKIINIFVVICAVLYILNAFGLFSGVHDIPVPRVR